MKKKNTSNKCEVNREEAATITLQKFCASNLNSGKPQFRPIVKEPQRGSRGFAQPPFWPPKHLALHSKCQVPGVVGFSDPTIE